MRRQITELTAEERLEQIARLLEYRSIPCENSEHRFGRTSGCFSGEELGWLYCLAKNINHSYFDPDFYT